MNSAATTNTHTTPEMAVRLKAAGWPQPEMKFGQYWAIKNDESSMCVMSLYDEFFSEKYGINPICFFGSLFDLAYCPSVIELMQALADLNADPQLEMHKGLFFARFETLDDLQCQSGHNAADLFGELWLKIKTT